MIRLSETHSDISCRSAILIVPFSVTAVVVVAVVVTVLHGVVSLIQAVTLLLSTLVYSTLRSPSHVSTAAAPLSEPLKSPAPVSYSMYHYGCHNQVACYPGTRLGSLPGYLQVLHRPSG